MTSPSPLPLPAVSRPFQSFAKDAPPNKAPSNGKRFKPALPSPPNNPKAPRPPSKPPSPPPLLARTASIKRFSRLLRCLSFRCCSLLASTCSLGSNSSPRRFLRRPRNKPIARAPIPPKTRPTGETTSFTSRKASMVGSTPETSTPPLPDMKSLALPMKSKNERLSFALPAPRKRPLESRSRACSERSLVPDTPPERPKDSVPSPCVALLTLSVALAKLSDASTT